ncbi:hypothetical protein RND81_08G197600 [Saponaria officinalis]|uniref:Prolamin-like domain-containing protein n=1 Tax=Saponaria officinalis TaxID=3572 RepID=A0AAW1JA18_SAPOF
MGRSLNYLIAFFLILATCSMARPINNTNTSTNNTSSIESPGSLITRLKLDDDSTNCWASMFRIQDCTGEIIQFFYDGETYLGPNCCNAIHIIVHDCWPNMLNLLGFTLEESDLLRVYCDVVANGPGPKLNGPTNGCVASKSVISVDKIN